MSSTRAEVLRLVSEVLEQPSHKVQLTDHFLDDLGASSLDIVTLVMRIEQHFSLGETPDAQLEQIRTVGDLVALVEQLREGGAGDLSEVSEPLDGVSLSEQRVDVVIASDHAGVGLKAELVDWLRRRGSVLDLGPSDASVAVDYPDFALMVGRKIIRGEARHGILICGSGIGMAIAANKLPGVRATIATMALQARLARQHNDANVLCLGARISGGLAAQACVEAFLTTPFEPGNDGRHARRVQLLEALRGEGR